MANILTSNPLKIDTASAAALLKGRMKATTLVATFEGATTGDQAIIHDQNSVVKLNLTVTVANASVVVPFPDDHPLVLDGILVPTLENCTLYVHLQDPPPAT